MAILVLAYIFYFGLISIMKFNSFSYNDFDLAVHDLAVWNMMHGSIFNSILGIPFLGNHMHLIMFFAVPLYMIFSHPITLLLLQTIALGFSAIPLYLLARRLIGNSWALVISAVYLFYPSLGYTNLYEFHPTVFATFFLAFTIYYYVSSSFTAFLIFAILSMLCQENIPLAIIMFGALAFFNKRKLKWILTPIFLGTVYFFAALSLMSYFNNNTIQFAAIYGYLGDSLPRVLLNLLMHPGLFIKLLFRTQSLNYLFSIFFPVSFLPLLAPLGLIPALPFFLQHIISARFTELTIFYHYTAEIIPFVFFAFIFAVQFLLKNKWIKNYQICLKICLLAIALTANIFMGPHFAALRNIGLYKKGYLDIYKDSLLAKIPKDASVVTTFEFLSHLSHRARLYSFHHVYMGYYTISSKRYELPKDVQYALIDFNDFLTFRSFYGPENYKNIRNLLSEGDFQAQDMLDSIVLFQKGAPAKYVLSKSVQEVPADLQHKSGISIDNEIQLMGYEISAPAKEGILEAVFYWHSLKHTDKDINIFLDVVDGNGALVLRKFMPICYRISPTNSWQEGQIFKDIYRIKIPGDLLKQDYELRIGFFDFRNNMICRPDEGADDSGRIFITDLK